MIYFLIKFDSNIKIKNIDDRRLYILIDKMKINLPKALTEIENGKKTSHWAWWAFPTEKEGNSEPFPKTAVTDETAQLLLDNAPPIWKKLLLKIAEKVIKGHMIKDIFLKNDIGRIRNFLTFWNKKKFNKPLWFNNVIELINKGFKETKIGEEKINNTNIYFIHGSVADFRSENGAIVNAANENCLGGGGIDEVITKRGGPELNKKRLELPVNNNIRCEVGNAKITTSDESVFSDTLGVKHIIHAVGPNFNKTSDEELLKNAYRNSLIVANNNKIEEIAFCLLSSGIFIGKKRKEDVIYLGINTIKEWLLANANISIKNVYIYAFSNGEKIILENYKKLKSL